MPAPHIEVVSWVKLHTKSLFSYALTKVLQKEVAEDLVQDTFMAACQSFDKYKGNSNIKTWLFSILKHKIADYYRLKYKQHTGVSTDAGTGFFDENEGWKKEYFPHDWHNETDLLEDPEFAKAFTNCLENLPQKWLAVVQSKYLYENDTKIVCSQLEISSSNFWQIIHRAKLQLRNCLQEKWFKNNNQ